MQFEQFQKEDGKNIINITVEKDDSEILKQDAENFIHKRDEIKTKEEENIDSKYEKYQYLVLGGIILTFILLVTLIILYVNGF